MQSSISILPADERMVHLANYLNRKGAVLCHSLSDIATSGLVLCATPFTKDGTQLNTSLSPPPALEDFLNILNTSHTIVGGGFPASVIHFCTQHNIPYYDLLSSEDLARKNARLTAEGLLVSLLSETNNSISEMIPLIIGYGKCGREIADILQMFTDEIYIYDVDEAVMKAAKSRDFRTITLQEIQSKKATTQQINTIINTSPTNPFAPKTWQCFEDSCRVFQVASGDLSLPYPLESQRILCPGIPGKYAPKSAGILIAKDICQHFHL